MKTTDKIPKPTKMQILEVKLENAYNEGKYVGRCEMRNDLQAAEEQKMRELRFKEIEVRTKLASVLGDAIRSVSNIINGDFRFDPGHVPLPEIAAPRRMTDECGSQEAKVPFRGRKI